MLKPRRDLEALTNACLDASWLSKGESQSGLRYHQLVPSDGTPEDGPSVLPSQDPQMTMAHELFRILAASGHTQCCISNLALDIP
jgi:hypothetical protein